jgi:phospholipid/cholesterol/gamma-HCH transport system substrate-binding protein
VRYVEIVPGTKGTPLAEGATIPASQTARPVSLDQVLGTFDPYTRARTQVLLQQFGGGTAGTGEDFNRAVELGPRFLKGLGSVSDAITNRPGAMSGLIRSADAAAAAFDPVRTDIAEGFDPEARAAGAFASSKDDIHSTLHEAPPALTEVRTGLPSVTALVGQVDGLAREGRPALAVAPGALRETSRLLVHARPALDRADRTLDLARRAVNPALDLLGKLRPVLPGLDTAMDSLLPSVRQASAHDCDIGNAMTGWSYSMAWGDDYGSGIRFYVHPHADQIGGLPEGGRLKDAEGRDLTETHTNVSAYPGPCVNGVGAEAGPERPTLYEYLSSLGYKGVKP